MAWFRGWLSAFVILALSQEVSLASAQPLEEFMKLRPKWDELVGLKFLIEGRVAGATDGVLGLQGCPIEFRAAERLPKFERKDVFEVSGELARDEKTQALYFRIDSVRKLDPDDKLLARRRSELSSDKPQPWYDLGAWAIARGEFYKDVELVTQGRLCYSRALQIERSNASRRTPERLEELSRQADELARDESLSMQLKHEAFLRRWDALRKSGTGLELVGLALQIQGNLPGAEQPLAANEAAAIRAEYLKSPLSVYDANETNLTLAATARAARRGKFHRALFIEIAALGLQKKAAADGRNGQEIAKEFEAMLPEFPQVPGEYRARELAYRATQAEKLTYEELEKLRGELSGLGRTQESKQVFDRWFRTREQTLRKQGIDGLIELAKLHENLKQDRRAAVQILFEADRARPADESVQQELERHGYHFHLDRWLTADEFQTEENSPIGRAMREGRVIPQMTELQVIKTLGRPTSRTRFLTSKHVAEYWVYRDARLSVRMSRQTNVKDLRVDAVIDLP